MPPKSKVLQSPNVNQILDWIDEGKSSRWISRELQNQFGETIGHVAISNFKKKNITAEALEIVDTELKNNKEKQNEEKVKSKIDQVAKKNAERTVESESQLNGITEATAKQYQGILNVASNFEDDYYRLRDEAKDYDSKITWKDVTEYSFKAQKLIHDILGGQSMEDSITEGFGELSDAIQKSREIIQKS